MLIVIRSTMTVQSGAAVLMIKQRTPQKARFENISVFKWLTRVGLNAIAFPHITNVVRITYVFEPRLMDKTRLCSFRIVCLRKWNSQRRAPSVRDSARQLYWLAAVGASGWGLVGHAREMVGSHMLNSWLRQCGPMQSHHQRLAAPRVACSARPSSAHARCSLDQLHHLFAVA